MEVVLEILTGNIKKQYFKFAIWIELLLKELYLKEFNGI